jgi:hypothetical protein
VKLNTREDCMDHFAPNSRAQIQKWWFFNTLFIHCSMWTRHNTHFNGWLRHGWSQFSLVRQKTLCKRVRIYSHPFTVLSFRMQDWDGSFAHAACACLDMPSGPSCMWDAGLLVVLTMCYVETNAEYEMQRQTTYSMQECLPLSLSFSLSISVRDLIIDQFSPYFVPLSGADNAALGPFYLVFLLYENNIYPRPKSR